MAPVGGKRRLLLDPSDGNNRATLSLPPLLRPPETQSSASGSASGSHQVGVTASSSTPESAAPPTIATGTSQTIEIDADVDTIDDHDERPVKRKKLTSEVWQYFNKVKVSIEENGKIYKQEWAHCKFKKCPYKGRCESITGTSGFWSHLKSHHSIVKGQQQLKAEKDKEKGIDVVEPYKYDEEASLRKLYVAIIMHEYPFNMVEHEYFREFITSLRPNFPLKSRVTVRKEILNSYMQERDKLYEYLKTVKCRLSATMDMWTSNQNKGYMCITLHWVDDDWRIQKRIVTFSHVEGRHTGVRLSEVFTTSMLRWFVEKKMFSLTLDNASANDVAVKDIIFELKKHGPLVCNGLFFHVRCACHILNLVAKDGLQEIESTTEKIKAFVQAVKGSPLQWEELMKCASECGLDTTKGLSTDVSTRWNSTYLMLADAMYYRAAFDRLTSYDRRRYEKMCPSATEWEKAMKIRAFLKIFFDLTELFSGTLYPTANLFYKGFCDIKITLTEWSNGKDNDITIRRMASAMLAKFDKYWNKSNTALAVASFLDPRFKMRIVQFCMEFIHQDMHPIKITEFLDIIKNMYDCFASAAPPRSHNEPEPNNTPAANHDPTEFVSALDKYLYRDETHNTAPEVNDLEKYMSEEPLKVTKANESTFDILAWWKNQKDDYPVLSLLARDVLVMQASTVASESAFSTGGRVIDPYRSRLDPEMVQALICTKDWIAGARRDRIVIQSIVADLELAELMANRLFLEDDDDVAMAIDDEMMNDVSQCAETLPAWCSLRLEPISWKKSDNISYAVILLCKPHCML